MGGTGALPNQPAVQASKRALRSALTRAFFGLARDVTHQTRTRSCLVLAPHQDDETLGCGATIMRKTDAGTPVWVVYATDGRASHRSRLLTPEALSRVRRRESLEACRRLGVPPQRVVHLDIPEGELQGRHLELRRRIAEILRAVRPAEVLVSSGLDRHPDHRALYQSAVDLLHAGELDGELFEYPIWFWMEPWWRVWLQASGRRVCGQVWRAGPAERRLRPVVVRTDDYLRRKQHALQAHASQLRNLTGETGWLTLHDVAGGQFLPRFFDGYEGFFRVTAQTTKGRHATDTRTSHAA